MAAVADGLIVGNRAVHWNGKQHFLPHNKKKGRRETLGTLREFPCELSGLETYHLERHITRS